MNKQRWYILIYQHWLPLQVVFFCGSRYKLFRTQNKPGLKQWTELKQIGFYLQFLVLSYDPWLRYIHMLWLATCFFLDYFSAKHLSRLTFCSHHLVPTTLYRMLFQNCLFWLSFNHSHLLKPFSTLMLPSLQARRKWKKTASPYTHSKKWAVSLVPRDGTLHCVRM